MPVLITGATGLIGRSIVKSYLEDRDTVNVLTRDVDRARGLLGGEVHIFAWDAASEDVPAAALEGVETVFHLMGEPVGGRWTKGKVERIFQSRIVSAQKLAKALKNAPCRFISASSFGIYSGRRDAVYDETYDLPPPVTRIQDILQTLERAVAGAGSTVIKVNMLRFGMVCANEGYPKKLVRLFKKGAGFIVGDGEQIVPIVDIDDAVGMMRWVASGQAGDGPVNCVAPQLPKFKDVAHSVAAETGTAVRLKIPKWLARPLLGGSADYFLLSYDVRPRKALDRGYNFRQSNPAEILRRAIQGA